MLFGELEERRNLALSARSEKASTRRSALVFGCDLCRSNLVLLWHGEPIILAVINLKPNAFYLKSLVLQGKVTALPADVREKLDVMLQQLENILSNSKYFCGDDVTLADLSILCSIGVLFVSFRYLIANI